MTLLEMSFALDPEFAPRTRTLVLFTRSQPQPPPPVGVPQGPWVPGGASWSTGWYSFIGREEWVALESAFARRYTTYSFVIPPPTLPSTPPSTLFSSFNTRKQRSPFEEVIISSESWDVRSQTSSPEWTFVPRTPSLNQSTSSVFETIRTQSQPRPNYGFSTYPPTKELRLERFNLRIPSTSETFLPSLVKYFSKLVYLRHLHLTLPFDITAPYFLHLRTILRSPTLVASRHFHDRPMKITFALRSEEEVLVLRTFVEQLGDVVAEVEVEVDGLME